ncbi:MAG: DegT/DnrJ/EryC1/StrS family aminotransferase [Bacteroidales bacterium]|nr:DegT/DnrJ/EryC1/StrS family aminotransferase [Bacteroidales bacterium]
MREEYNKIPITKPSITKLEIDYVNDAISHGWGEKCYEYIKLFEKSFAEHIGCKNALATSSCTGAIHLALMALGVKSGDEVIVPEITWIATVEPILHIGAKPIFVDVLPDTWCINSSKIENAITLKTKAIIAVHVYGNVCEMDEILNIAKKHKLKVLEDAAEGIGSKYKNKRVGSIGDAGVFSFHGTKTIATGEGGILVSNDRSLIEKAAILNDHGRDPKINKTFWMENYGYKYKISNLQAAMGCAQMERVNELIDKKREIFKWYENGFKDWIDQGLVKLNHTQNFAVNGYWMPTIIFDKSLNVDREVLFDYMKKRNVDVRPFFYPLSSLPIFDNCEENIIAYDIFNRGINLPSFHDITTKEVQFVIDLIKSFFE